MFFSILPLTLNPNYHNSELLSNSIDLRCNYGIRIEKETRISRGKVARLAGIEPAAYGSGDRRSVP